MHNHLSFRPRSVQEALRWQTIDQALKKEDRRLKNLFQTSSVDLQTKKIIAIQSVSRKMLSGKKVSYETIGKINEGETYAAFL